MKLILTILLLSNMLFAVQKQIILGSYSVKENASNELANLNKHIDSDAALKELMYKYSLRSMNTAISGYTVVSVNYFDSYIEMHEVMKALKDRYGDMFTLKYPTRGISDKEYIKDVRAKAAIEQAQMDQEQMEQTQTEAIANEDDLVVMEEANNQEEELIQDQDQEEEQVSALREQNIQKMKLLKIAKENQLKKEKQQGLGNKKNLDSKEVEIEEKETLTSIDNKEIIENKDVGLDSYYIIIGLIFLILIIGGFIISRQFFQKI